MIVIIISIIVFILLLGVINIGISKAKVKAQKNKVIDFLNVISRTVEKIKNGSDYSQEAIFILSNADDLAEIEDAIWISAVYNLVSDVKRRDVNAIGFSCQKISSDCITWISKLEKKSKITSSQFANPFIWFYRGIELILKIVFGYFIKKFNPEFNFEGNPWKIINTIFSIISGAASIIALVIELLRLRH